MGKSDIVQVPTKTSSRRSSKLSSNTASSHSSAYKSSTKSSKSSKSKKSTKSIKTKYKIDKETTKAMKKAFKLLMKNPQFVVIDNWSVKRIHTKYLYHWWMKVDCSKEIPTMYVMIIWMEDYLRGQGISALTFDEFLHYVKLYFSKRGDATNRELGLSLTILTKHNMILAESTSRNSHWLSEVLVLI